LELNAPKEVQVQVDEWINIKYLLDPCDKIQTKQEMAYLIKEEWIRMK